MRCFVIGIDAACQRVLDPLFDQEVTPTLESIFRRGVSDSLHSQIPPWTPSAWPSLCTGTNPGKHGIFDFLAFDGYDWDVVDATRLHEPALWEYLSAAGYESVVVNVPLTHPPKPFDGALVPGYIAPERPVCHPEGLLAEIRDAIGDYRIYPDSSDDGTTDDYAAHREVVHMRGEAFEYLAERFDPAFGFLQFQQTDTVFHKYPDDWDAVRAVYEAVDAELDRILDRFDPETVLVVSDHGMGEYDDYEFRVNEFLRETGHVATTRGGTGMPSWALVRDSKLTSGETGDPDRSPLGSLMRQAARLGITTQRVVAVLDALGLADTVGRFVPPSVASSGAEQVDFSASTAFMRSRSELGVRINLEGREPHGQVPQDEYEDVRSDLIRLFTDVRTPDGDRVFADVAPREAYFDGPVIEEAVDIVLVPANFEQFLSARLAGATFGTPSEPWNHKLDGIVAAAGTGVDTSVSLGDADLFDIAPTVLALFGLPRGARMDGTPLPIVDSAGVSEYDSIDRSDSNISATSGEVQERLENLGYIENI
ncbi:phosphodiesterase [Halobacteriales archaeon QS_4_62_28]|nr:MAG: phosphodiesterase [Halobacteriales archaeon QS_4_62_28]